MTLLAALMCVMSTCMRLSLYVCFDFAIMLLFVFYCILLYNKIILL